MAKIADIYGRRWIVVLSYALFVVGAIVSMTAKSVRRLPISRARIGELTRSANRSTLSLLARSSPVLPLAALAS